MLGVSAAQLGQGVHRVAGSAAILLHFVDAEGGVASQGQRQHFHALIETSNGLTFLLRRPWRRDEPYLVEPRLIARLFGEDEMAEMDRIERTAEDADAHAAPSVERGDYLSAACGFAGPYPNVSFFPASPISSSK